MDKNTLLAKTDQGREALTTRPPNLGPRLRSLLIMVDGKRSVGDMDKLLGGEGVAGPLLEQLEAAGWIAQVDADGTLVSHSASADAGAVAPGHAGAASPHQAPLPALPFSEARRLVARFLNDQLGPMGEQLALRVEACKTPADLQILLPRLREGLKNYKNAATVQQFDQELVARLPKI